MLLDDGAGHMFQVRAMSLAGPVLLGDLVASGYGAYVCLRAVRKVTDCVGNVIFSR